VLELKVIADAGLVGLPNAGKSTLLSRLSRATPEIADYPFTTKHPNLGIVTMGDAGFVLADLPGLIEGASEGHGLGHRFLRHVERCRVIVQLVDVSEDAVTAPVDAWRIVDGELARFSEDLALRPRLLAASKCESPEAEARALELEAQSGIRVWRISSARREGLETLLGEAYRRVHELAV